MLKGLESDSLGAAWEQKSEAHPLYCPCPSPGPGLGPNPEKLTHPLSQLQDQRRSA